ncbi:MAG: polysaccharide deacetylase family protein, partial [Bacteroidota bacterium]
MRFFSLTPLQVLFPSVVWSTSSSALHLTFDDGPHPVATPRLLQVLRDRGVQATFFLCGEAANNHPRLVREIHADGHVIGSHGYDHRRLMFRGAAT